MKTKTINLYQFSELSDEAKEKAIEKFWDINVDYNWWDMTYEDAKNVNFNILEFDLDRRCFVKGEFVISAPDTAELIKVSHGNECETFDTAKEFLTNLNELTSKSKNIEDVNEDDIEELENDFLQSLCEDYRIILTKEYEYLTSEEAIIGTIEANEYDFDEDGNLI
jgi:hypothetical protein